MNLSRTISRMLRPFHRHQWDQIYGHMRPCGVTLGWDMRPTTEYEMLERCVCGEERRTRGWVLPRPVEDFRRRSVQ